MTSAIGDFAARDNEKKKEDTSMLARFLNPLNKAIAFLPDTLINGLNQVPQGLAALGDSLLNRIPGVPENILEKGASYIDIPKDPIDKALRYISAIKDLPVAEDMVDKQLESWGSTLGSLLIPGGLGMKGAGIAAKESAPLVKQIAAGAQGLGKALFGTEKPVTALSQLATPATAATLTGAASQATMHPYIQDVFPEGGAAQFGLDLLAGGLGGGVGGLAAHLLSKQSPRALPLATAAQRLDLSDPRAPKMIARQLDLTKKDPKAAAALQQIATNQESNIDDQLMARNPISGSTVVEEIKDQFKKAKTTLSEDYASQFDAARAATRTPVPIDTTKTLIEKIYQSTPEQSPFRGQLTDIFKEITENAGDKRHLRGVKTEIQGKTQYKSGLGFDDTQSAELKRIAHQLNEDIKDHMPGYKKASSQYAAGKKDLNQLEQGVVGGLVETEIDHPNQVIRQMFEKTDADRVGQLQKVLSPKTYDQAADMYLEDALRRSKSVGESPLDGLGKAVETSTKNIYNKQTEYSHLADILKKQRPVLENTLPESQNLRVDNVISDINQTLRGRPRNDYMIQANRDVAVGDEVKGLGKASLTQRALNTLGGNYLKREEMLTGITPTGQVIDQAANAVPRLMQKGLTADVLAQPDPAPVITPETAAQSVMEPQAAPAAPPQLNTKAQSFDQWMQGGGQASAPPPPPPPVANGQGVAPQDVNPNVPQASAPKKQANFNDWFSALPKNESANQASPQDVEKESHLNAYRTYASSVNKPINWKDKADMMGSLKNSAQRVYPDNPIMQRVAISQAILESGLLGTPSQLASKYNNLFGIKAGKTAPGTGGSVNMGTTEYEGGAPVSTSSGFAVNNNIDDSFNQHKALMNRASRYAPVVNAQDPNEAFMALQQAGYATDPAYARKLAQVYVKNVEPLFKHSS